MPYNLLLLPLLAGFIFLTKSYLFAYSTSQLSREYLLVRASISGLAFLAISRVLCTLLVSISPGLWLANGLHTLAPFPFIGTALGAPIIAYLVTITVNYIVPKNVAGDWLYHSNKFDQMESLLLSSAFGVPPLGEVSKKRLIFQQAQKIARNLLWFMRAIMWGRKWRAKTRLLKRKVRRSRTSGCFAYGAPMPVMLNMTDSKVYVGFIAEFPPVQGGPLKFVRVLPIWSGYRTSDTKEVVYVTSYTNDLLRDDVNQSRLAKILPCCEISSASFFQDGLFEIKTNRSRKRNICMPRKALPRRKIP